jgi:uncharacterized membrane protein
MFVIAGGLVVMLIAWLGKIGKLPRNHFAGIRLPSTMRSDRAWAAAHRAGWTMTFVSSLFLIALGVRILMIGAEDAEGEVWWFVGPMLATLLVAAVQARNAAKAEYEAETHG